MTTTNVCPFCCQQSWRPARQNSCQFSHSTQHYTRQGLKPIPTESLPFWLIVLRAQHIQNLTHRYCMTLWSLQGVRGRGGNIMICECSEILWFSTETIQENATYSSAPHFFQRTWYINFANDRIINIELVLCMCVGKSLREFLQHVSLLEKKVYFLLRTRFPFLGTSSLPATVFLLGAANFIFCRRI